MAKRNRNTFQKRDPGKGYLPLTISEIYNQERRVQEDKKYGNKGDGKLLEDYFNEHPKNDDYTTVLHKVILIDFTNSTQLQQYGKKFTYTLAERIKSILNLDERIANGDPTVVDEIAELTPINLFSFASKFCHYHNRICYKRDDYSIFDRVVSDTLPQYLVVTKSYIRECKNDKKDNTKKETEKKSYKDYRDIIDKLIEAYNLESVPMIRKQLDHFLWFPNKDKRKKLNKSSENE